MEISFRALSIAITTLSCLGQFGSGGEIGRDSIKCAISIDQPKGQLTSRYTVAKVSTNDGPVGQLRWLVSRDTIVAIGTVSEKVREEHSPASSEGLFQSTAFRVKLANVIHSRISLPASIMVRQGQGHLPWTGPNGSSGLGFRIEGQPMLHVGERYLLLLRSDLEGYAYSDEDAGEIARREAEFTLVHPQFGMWLIQNGILQTPKDPEIPPLAPSVFKEGVQLLGKAEQEVLPIFQNVIRERWTIPSDQAAARQKYLRDRNPGGSFKPAEEIPGS